MRHSVSSGGNKAKDNLPRSPGECDIRTLGSVCTRVPGWGVRTDAAWAVKRTARHGGSGEAVAWTRTQTEGVLALQQGSFETEVL